MDKDDRTRRSTATLDTVATFEKAMSDHGLACPDPLILDGEIHRYRVQGDKANSNNGWYVLFDGDNPTIVFGSWKTGETITQSLKNPQDFLPLEREQYQQHISKAKQAAERERKTLQLEAAIRAQGIWNESLPAPEDHPYLIEKRISPHGVRVSKGKLVIPAYDDAGTIVTLQLIQRCVCARAIRCTLSTCAWISPFTRIARCLNRRAPRAGGGGRGKSPSSSR